MYFNRNKTKKGNSYLHFSLDLHSDARYPTRSYFVNGSVAIKASSMGGVAATITLFLLLLRNPTVSRGKNSTTLAVLHVKEVKLTDFSLIIETSTLFTTPKAIFYPIYPMLYHYRCNKMSLP
ncbi:hypothetical protein ES332_D02G142600v1 [Gossypium tomentosum]|uniref:Uncharacterized protein n=1 Tax=Gossypium tomentosum TaxID=34277 RepID=A0A5D2LX13_GOSTO|nr:hypothetical protein ES332_D02G142600v1 [Gossypium tomentosum]